MKFAWAVYTEFAIFLPRGRASPRPRAGMDSPDAEVGVDPDSCRAARSRRPSPPLAALRLVLEPGGRGCQTPTVRRGLPDTRR
jgi:hypothetical protein